MGGKRDAPQHVSDAAGGAVVCLSCGGVFVKGQEVEASHTLGGAGEVARGEGRGEGVDPVK